MSDKSYDKEYDDGFFEKCAEYGLDPEMVKEAFLGALGRGVKSLAFRGGSRLGNFAAKHGKEGGRLAMLGKNLAGVSDDAFSALGKRRAVLDSMKGMPRGEAFNSLREGVMAARPMQTITPDALIGGAALGAGGMGALSLRRGGGQQPPRTWQPSLQDMQNMTSGGMYGGGSTPNYQQFMID